MKGVFMNLTKFHLRGNNQLCSLNKEIVQNLGVLLCLVGKKKRNSLLHIILPVVGATALFISMLVVFCTIKKKRKETKISVSLTPLRGLPQNISYAAVDENEVLKVADRRLIDNYQYSTQSSGIDDHSSGIGSNTHSIRKAEECIAGVIRVGLCCTAHQPKDR
ncbi:hypothetical protein JHK85_011413 [Glycine max]|nr:hypothetical protein JHK85_011413 [Glycine max]